MTVSWRLCDDSPPFRIFPVWRTLSEFGEKQGRGGFWQSAKIIRSYSCRLMLDSTARETMVESQQVILAISTTSGCLPSLEVFPSSHIPVALDRMLRSQIWHHAGVSRGRKESHAKEVCNDQIPTCILGGRLCWISGGPPRYPPAPDTPDFIALFSFFCSRLPLLVFLALLA